MWDVWTRADLVSKGLSSRLITAETRAGTLIRARQGRYLAPDAPPGLVQAIRVGGRLGCLSLLAALGVFVFDSSVLHVHMTRGSSRMRSARARAPLEARLRRKNLVLHWHPLVDMPTLGTVGIIDALIHAVRCQAPRHAVATLDSALHLGLVGADRVPEIFAALPARFAGLRMLLDARAESGPETLVRLMARGLGYRVDLQVEFEEVGRVDLVLDGWLVVECDSKKFHSSWKQQLKDFHRDKKLAAMGYCVLRLAAEDILYEPESVLAALRGLRSSR